MQPVPAGTRIRVLSNEFNHSYTIGCVYTVTQIDDDGTFKAVDDKGRVGNWLRWSECEPAAPSIWSRVAADLPEPLVRFLSCFDGIGDITLKEKVIDAVLAKLADLPERIVAAAATPLGANATVANQPQQPPQQSAHQSPQQ